jgi:hypothetical protein
MEKVWEEWVQAGRVGAPNDVVLNDIRWANPHAECKYPSCPGCFSEDYLETVQLTAPGWKARGGASLLAQRLEHLRDDEPVLRAAWAAVPFGGSSFFSSFTLPSFPTDAYEAIVEHAAAMAALEDIRRVYNEAVDSETQALLKISFLTRLSLSSIQTQNFSRTKHLVNGEYADQVLFDNGPWEGLYAKVQAVRSAREQVKGMSERFNLPMEQWSGTSNGWRREYPDRKYVLNCYKALCARWLETVGPWGTVAVRAAERLEKAAADEAAQAAAEAAREAERLEKAAADEAAQAAFREVRDILSAEQARHKTVVDAVTVQLNKYFAAPDEMLDAMHSFYVPVGGAQVTLDQRLIFQTSQLAWVVCYLGEGACDADALLGELVVSPQRVDPCVLCSKPTHNAKPLGGLKRTVFQTIWRKHFSARAQELETELRLSQEAVAHARLALKRTHEF